MKRTRNIPAQRSASSRQGGAVIIVVLALMTTLVFLGLFFYNWTGQERANAEFFGNAQPLELDPDPIFDASLEQLIVGTRADKVNSALWGGLHSMLAHQIGQIGPNLAPADFGVKNGWGIRIEFEDLDDDGYPDDENDFYFVYDDRVNPPSTKALTGGLEDRFVIHFSRVAQPDPTLDAFGQTDPAYAIPNYQPDVDYTYPDINTLFLAHEEWQTIDPDGTERRLVLIPSFFRPQYFPALRSTDGSGSGFSTLYTDLVTARQVLRPHQFHRYDNVGPTLRFLNAITPAESGDQTRVLQPFPFRNSLPEGRLGIFSDSSSEAASLNYALLDADLDGDGVKDAIWMDLDHPLIDLPGGRQVVPLSSFKVLDADGLLNLNVHGNLEALVEQLRSGSEPDPNVALDNLLTMDAPFSQSNLGMSRGEVNPVWAFRGDLSTLTTTEETTALAELLDIYGPVTAGDTMRIANLEFFHLLHGRPQSLLSQGFGAVGRWGDEAILNNTDPANLQIPLPGLPSDFAAVTDADDDFDEGRYGQPIAGALEVGGVNIPGFVHPVPPTGLGLAGAYVNSATGAQRRLAQPDTDNPSRWLQYEQWLGLNPTDPLELSYPPGLQANGTRLVDENDEMLLEPGARGYGQHDRPFESREAAALQLSNADLSRTLQNSRVLDLGSVNFLHARDAQEIRRQFTVNSWNRLEFGYTPFQSRAWEYPLDSVTGQPTFPPEFTPAAGVVDPFREEVRELLRTEFGQAAAFGPHRERVRHRLLLDRILSNDTDGANNRPAFVNGNPRFRNLVPHPLELTGTDTVFVTNPTMFHDVGFPPVDFSDISTDVYAQEWWARYDRQRLARDIYVLLWTLGQESTIPSAEQAREMAQFAVNVVDAMDRDRIITCFEYDPDLSDGWSIDSASLETVYGVEHQELTFNELLFIRTRINSGDDSDVTEFDEEDGDFYHAFVELKNAAPWEVPISDGSWRIRRTDSLAGATGRTPFVSRFRETPAPATPTVVTGGGQLVIGCQDGYNLFPSGNPRPSDFRIDHDSDGNFNAVVPNVFDTINPNTGTPETSYIPLVDLDLMHVDHDGRHEGPYKADRRMSLLNREFDNETDGTPLAVNVELVLERRLRPDPNDELPEEANPWIEVDRADALIREWDPNATDLAVELEKLRSFERREPFDPGDGTTPIMLPTVQEYNEAITSNTSVQGFHSMPYFQPEAGAGAGGDLRNSVSPDPFRYWQPHFDRDFTSVAELLSIPLYGPREDDGSPWQYFQHGSTTKNLVDQITNQLANKTAAVRFRFPQESAELPPWIPDDVREPADPMNPVDGHYPNHWHRLLEYVSVWSQEDQRAFSLQIAPGPPPEQVGLPLHRRTPGQINLNAIRHESVFKGLIDDRFHFDPGSTGSWPTSDAFEPDRDWYGEFRLARDGLDSVLGVPADPTHRPITIPGGLNARPFRSLAFINESLSDGDAVGRSVEQTVLRNRMSLSDPTLFDNKHGLFEARAEGDLGVDAVDYHSRDRILGKVMNNSTTRSNVFFVWVGIDFFDAHQLPNGAVQVGAKNADLPTYRLFCVVDMSRLEEAYDPVSGSFDFRKFIIHRQLLP